MNFEITSEQEMMRDSFARYLDDTCTPERLRAAEAAKQAGKERIDELGLNADSMRDQFRVLVNKASEAVKAAGQAAASETRRRD